MSESEGTYAALMKLQQANPKPASSGKQPDTAEPPANDITAESTKPKLSPELDNVSRVGYVSHSFRFTTDEKDWLDSFCIQISAKTDRKITHNTLLRVLLRVADDVMKKKPDKNDLLDKLLQLKD